MAVIDFKNSTDLDGDSILADIRRAVEGWRVGHVTVRVRYSRGADFSGTCYYKQRRIFVNLGRHLTYPYAMRTNLARAKTQGRIWFRPVYLLELKSGYEVVQFIFLHELYHLLIKIARRNMRQKESMCDRFAARHLVDRWGAQVRTAEGLPVPREEWSFQDLDGFVAAARQLPRRRTLTRPLPARERSVGTLTLPLPEREKDLVEPSPFQGEGRVRVPMPLAARQLVLFPS